MRSLLLEVGLIKVTKNQFSVFTVIIRLVNYLVKLFYYDYKGLVDEGKIKGKWGGMVMESSKCGMRIFEFGRVLMSALIGFKKRGLSPVGEGQ